MKNVFCEVCKNPLVPDLSQDINMENRYKERQDKLPAMER